jgi:hypothetical protein
MIRATKTGIMPLIAGALGLLATGWASVSHAQDPAPVEGAPPVTGAPPEPPPTNAPPPPPPPPVAARVPEREIPSEHNPSDLDVAARPWAIGYAGLSQVPVGLVLGPTGQLQPFDITVPAIGLRYWASQTMGIDVAVGFGWSAGSRESAGVSTDKDAITGLIVQGGVPIALSTYRHASFQLIPYGAIAYGRTSLGGTIAGSLATDLSGTRVEVGSRAGFELFFGFIGIPELALSATLGMRFELLKHSTTTGGVTDSDTTFGFSTTVQNSPWDIFTGNVAARYYF